MRSAHRHSPPPCPVAQEEQDWLQLYRHTAPWSIGQLHGKEGGTGAEARGKQPPSLLPPSDLRAHLVGQPPASRLRCPQAGHPSSSLKTSPQLTGKPPAGYYMLLQEHFN